MNKSNGNLIHDMADMVSIVSKRLNQIPDNWLERKTGYYMRWVTDYREIILELIAIEMRLIFEEKGYKFKKMIVKDLGSKYSVTTSLNIFVSKYLNKETREWQNQPSLN